MNETTDIVDGPPEPAGDGVVEGTTEDELLATVVILTYNGERYLPDLLREVTQQHIDGRYEVLVIDSGSTDRTLELLREYPQVRLVQIPNSEFGHGRTRNMAAHLARGRYVAYLTHDAVPASRRWLHELLEPFRLHPDVAAVLGRQIPRAWCFPLLKHEIRAVFGGLGPEFGTTLFYDADFITTDAIRNAVTFYSDVNSAARRDLLTGPLPYRDVSYAEDQLLGRDIIAAGLLKAYAARAAVWHSNDLTLGEYDDRMEAETLGQREVGIEIGAPSIPATVVAVLRGTVGDTLRLLRDHEYTWQRKLYFLVLNPFFHVQKWRGVRRGALAPRPGRAPESVL